MGGGGTVLYSFDIDGMWFPQIVHRDSGNLHVYPIYPSFVWRGGREGGRCGGWGREVGAVWC